ncbi:MAG: alkaline phosphatase, partial [Candidatus Delongbacteria bacterium]|nr:alkaline phosphatase [Candidatus Delongbacteria bacterium]
FYFIGDGMGMPQISATERYLAALDGKEGQRKLNITKFPNQTMVTTYAEDRFITGSAAAGTALATGNKTTINTISMDGKREKPLKTIAEIAKSEGKKVGIISSVSIDHATPAAFYAHQPTRKMLYEIGLDMIKADFDFYGGGDVVYPRGKDKSASKGDVYEELKKAGYKITRDKNEFKSLNQNSGKVFAISPTLDADKATRYAMDQNPKDDISLKELTIKAVEMFSGNEKGFFVMVEGGKIDWACHANDAAATIHDVLAFDDAVGVAVDFYNKHPEETLIVIVGDHETGGMTLGFSGRQYDSAFEVLKNQKMSYLAFDESVIQPMKNIDGIAKLNKDQLIEKFWSEIYIQIQNNFSLGTDKLPLNEYEINILKDAFAASMLGEKIAPKSDQTYLLYGGYEPLSIKLTTILNQKAGIGWTSYSHTGVPIPAYAMGCGQELFFGYNDNTDVAKNIIAVMSEQN